MTILFFSRARLLLRKKKYQENLLSNAETQLEAVEKLCLDLEFAVVEIQVLNGLRTGNEALKKVHELMDIDQIESILEETKEGIEKQREIDELLSGALTDEDEAAVLNEFEEMVAEGQKDMMEYIDDDISEKLPDVPAADNELEPRRATVLSKRVALMS